MKNITLGVDDLSRAGKLRFDFLCALAACVLFLCACVQGQPQNGGPTTPGPTAEETFVRVGKVVEESANPATGSDEKAQTHFVTSLAVPLPPGVEVGEAVITPSLLLDGSASITQGETEPVFLYQLVSASTIDELESGSQLFEVKDIALDILAENRLPFPEKVTAASDRPLYFVLSADAVALREQKPYSIQLPATADPAATFGITVLAVPLYEPFWTAVQGRVEVEFR